MKVLVTGATGFVGRALVPALHDHELVTPSRAELGDIGAATDWRPYLQGVDAVVHLANRAHDSRIGEGEIRRINVDGTRRLAEQALEARVSRFIYLSSIKAVTERSVHPLSERDVPMPTSTYGRTKLNTERMLRDLPLQLLLLRPPLIVGPGAKANLRSLLRLADTPFPLPFGEIENRRSMLALSNLTDAIRLSLETGVTGTYLLADEPPVSTAWLLERLRSSLGRPARLLRAPEFVRRLAPAALIEDLEIDPRGFANATGFKPFFRLEQAIETMVAAYRLSKAR
ncbi:NAD-dependent epimerase/dehydratase family protein [Roseiterribacter gracilis]|uniref:Epimerase n=1 Tax=Roseiterribacter gracilis TaxID=2812848 RepID=A0A8S8XBZ0_9PROT|nr:epimerase [Rhodospirillales bacterium TMPK1]